MGCPICGAICKCKNRGVDGTCCSCHRHKTRLRIRPEYYDHRNLTQAEIEAVNHHKKDMDHTFGAILKNWHERMTLAEYGVLHG